MVLILIVFTFTFNRVRLFNMINDLPTVYEVVFGVEQSDEQSGMDNGAKDTPSPQVKLNVYITAILPLCWICSSATFLKENFVLQLSSPVIRR